MSLSDTKYNIEMTVIQPLQHFRTLAASLDHIHNNCLGDFSKSIAGLLTGSDGDVAFQGPGSDALAKIVGDYLDIAQKLTGTTDTFLCQRLSDAATICEKHAKELQQALDSIKPAQLDGAAAGVGGFAIVADAGAGAQLGLDVPWDIVAAGATLLAGGLMLAAANSENAAIDQAVQVKDVIVYVWQKDMDSGPNTEPLPKLPQDPQGPDGNDTSFLKTLGIVAGTIVALGALGALTWNDIKDDSYKRQAALDALKKEFPECNDAFLEKFLADHPDVPLDQIRRALQLMRLQAQYQALLNQIDALHDPRLSKIRSDIATNLKALNRANPFTVTDANIEGWANNLNSANTELVLALQFINNGQLAGNQQNVNFTWTDASGKSTPTRINVDDIITITDSNGNPVTRWVEVKNIKPFTTGSKTWTDPDKGMQTVVERYIQAAQQNGVKDIEFDFPQGVTDSVKQAIEEMGRNAGINITVNTPPVAPPIDPGSSWCTA
ncbi:MAG TPA: hypothetical protein VFV38_40540 [Ktedonobacteraceae bacterium]|nr:hypothetical protein [Ktedonobacteraceae bacterium]